MFQDEEQLVLFKSLYSVANGYFLGDSDRSKYCEMKLGVDMVITQFQIMTASIIKSNRQRACCCRRVVSIRCLTNLIPPTTVFAGDMIFLNRWRH